MIGWIILAILILIAIYAVVLYNRLVRLQNGYENAFAQIDVQLTRRHDLIPNLVSTAKGYLEHERETLEEVTRARTAAVNGLDSAKSSPGNAQAMQDLAGSENMLTQALGRLFAVVEAYPDLKASQNMMQLSEQLTTTENRIAFARQAFNDSVMGYNNAVETFPNNLIANTFGFSEAEMLEIEEPEKREAPTVEF